MVADFLDLFSDHGARASVARSFGVESRGSNVQSVGRRVERNLLNGVSRPIG